MSRKTAKFFGQFLLEQGELDDAELRQALDLMELENQTLGELAVAAGFASDADCRRVNGEQRRRDLPFGELAVQMGVLSTVELEELLQQQRETRLDLGAAVVRLGLLPDDHVRVLRDRFKSEQSEVAGDACDLPGPLQGHRTAELTVSALPRFCRWVARMQAIVGPGRELETLPDDALVASLSVIGIQGLRITMIVKAPFGGKLASGILGLPLDDLAAELALEAVGEFLNVLMGNVVSALEEEAIELRLESPTYGVLPTSGWCFPIATESDGDAHVILELL
jgi:hypothetical protein